MSEETDSSKELRQNKQEQPQKLPYQVERLKEPEAPIESETALNRDMMHVDSDANIDFFRQVKEDGTELFQEVVLPYIKMLNDDLTKGYLKEEEVAWAKTQLFYILDCVYFARSFGLYLPHINKEISKLHATIVITRSREMAAPRLSKSTITYESTPSSPWLLERQMQELAEKEGLGEKLLRKLKPKEGEMKFTKEPEKIQVR